MRVTLLSAGPSLKASYDPARAGEIVIGVNTAATLYPLDYWSCCDQSRFEIIKPIGAPTLFTLSDQHNQMLARNRKKVKPHKVIFWETVFVDTGTPPEWLCWSAPSALILAQWLGAKQIDCYGVDMDGTADAINEDMSDQRQPKRWEREAKLWKDIVRLLNSKGIGVTRHGIQP